MLRTLPHDARVIERRKFNSETGVLLTVPPAWASEDLRRSALADALEDPLRDSLPRLAAPSAFGIMGDTCRDYSAYDQIRCKVTTHVV